MIEYYYNTFRIFCLLSAIYVSVKVLSKFWWLINSYLLPRCKKERDYKYYGQWAVITGSTDGIGKGFAMELASKGMDICLISRNEEKLKNTANEIEKCYRVKTIFIVADFRDSNVYNHIREKLTNLDIGILVNNVGFVVYKFEPYDEQSEEDIKNNICVNILPTSMMTSIVLPCMIPKKRGLIINVSSMAAEIFLPYFSTQSAAKTYVSTFGRCLNYELKKHNIQMTTLTTGLVHTNLLGHFSGLTKFTTKYMKGLTTTVESYVRSSLLASTSGSWKMSGYFFHDVYLIMSQIVPFGIVGEVAFRMQEWSKKQQPK